MPVARTIQNSLIPLMEMTDRYNKIINDVSIAYQAVNPIEIFIKTMPPIDLLERISLTQSTLEQIHNSFNIIDWTTLNSTLNNILQSISNFHFDFISIKSFIYLIIIRSPTIRAITCH